MKRNKVEDEAESGSNVETTGKGLQSLEWSLVDVKSSTSGRRGDMAGFYCLEEIDGYDVKVEGNENSGIMVSFKKNPAYKPKKRSRPIEKEAFDPETPLDEAEAQKYIHVDEFVEPELPDTDENDNEHSADGSASESEKAKETVTKKKVKAASEKKEKQKSSKNSAWDEKPAYVDLNMSAWNAFNLSEKVIASLHKLGFKKPTEIQKRVLEVAGDGKNIVGASETASILFINVCIRPHICY